MIFARRSLWSSRPTSRARRAWASTSGKVRACSKRSCVEGFIGLRGVNARAGQRATASGIRTVGTEVAADRRLRCAGTLEGQVAPEGCPLCFRELVPSRAIREVAVEGGVTRLRAGADATGVVVGGAAAGEVA